MNEKEELVRKIKNGEITAEEAVRKIRTKHDKTLFYHNQWVENESGKPDKEKQGTTLYIGDFDYVAQMLEARGSKLIRTDSRTYSHTLEQLVNEGKQITSIVICPQFSSEQLQENVKADLEILLTIVQWLKQNQSNISVNLYYCMEYNFLENGMVPAGVGGFLQTIHLENPMIHYKVVYLADEAKNITMLSSELSYIAENETEVKFENGKRYVKKLEECKKESNVENVGFKKDGVYIITGGMGKIGRLFARFISRQYANAKVILTGRSKTCKEPLELENLNKTENGSKVVYLGANVEDYQQVQKLVADVKAKYGKIDGVIHLAGIVKDALYINKTQQDVLKVVEPKVMGVIHLANALQEEKLDFILLGSSTTSIFGNTGQSDYAYANRFLDEFAAYRNSLSKEGKVSGRTLSINWPLWENGGMEVSNEIKQWMKKTVGFESMPDAEGVWALQKAVERGKDQIVVMYGDTAVMREKIEKGAEKKQKSNENLSNADQDKMHASTIAFLTKILSDETKVPEHKISANKSFGLYGIDSIMTVNMTIKLEDVFGSLSKTLFYEYQCIEDLAQYFETEHQDKLLKLFHMDAVVEEKKQGVKKSIQPQERKISRFIKENGQKEEKPVVKTKEAEDEIAIIGVSGRYPMANNLYEYWNNLKAGKDCISFIPADRWDYKKHYTNEKGVKGKTNGKWGGFLEDVDKFDALFFHMTPYEAQHLDPQERLFLQTSWQTIEDAGYKADELCDGNVGVFVGVMYGEYQLYGIEQTMKGDPIALGSSYSSIANRVSYSFDFHGPSIALDTMCSSSLTSIHLACESIRKGECEAAIAGGVNLSIHPNKYILLNQTNFLDSEGRCHTFGTGGDGYVPGEGVGAVLLKPLSKAIEDKDYIYAVIKASALNHGGKTSGFTVPNPIQQGKVISQALKSAQINPRTINYIEAHGTGTALGDPIEITGLSKAFSEYTNEKQFCSIGSVKSNVGHLESASGIAAITKVLLQMKYKKLVPSIHSEQLNPNIDFANSPFFVQKNLSDWEKPVYEENGVQKEGLRRAGISSFGAGGSNAHFILEEYENPVETQEDGQSQLIILSAKDKERLIEYAKELVQYINTGYRKDDKVIEYRKEEISNSHVIEDVCTITASVMNLDKESMNSSDSLMEYGIDRVNLVEILQLLKEKYEFDDEKFFYDEEATLQQIAESISGNVEKYQMIQTQTEMVADIDTISMPSLRQIAYTLQTGRVCMEEKLAIVASSISDLYQKLEKYIEGEEAEEEEEGIFTGNSDSNSKEISMLLSGSTRTLIMDTLIENRELEKLAQLYINGIDIEWDRLYGGDIPYKVSLPAYPFAKERCWYEGPQEVVTQKTECKTLLRPLLSRNISNFEEQKYMTELIPEESHNSFFVQNEQVLYPGILLEMAYEAADTVFTGEQVKQVRNIMFNGPVIKKDKTLSLITELWREHDAARFEISSEYGEDASVVYAQGTMELVNSYRITREKLDLENIKAKAEQVQTRESCYEALKAAGYSYQEEGQFLQDMYQGEHGILCGIERTEFELLNQPEYQCDPYIIEAMLQAFYTWNIKKHGMKEPSLIVSISKMECYQKLEHAEWVYVEEENGYILEENGNVLAVISGWKTESVKEVDVEEEEGISRFLEKTYRLADVTVSSEPFTGTAVIIGNEKTTGMEQEIRRALSGHDIEVIRCGKEKLSAQYCMDATDENSGQQAASWLVNNKKNIGAIIDISDLQTEPQDKVVVQMGKVRLLQTIISEKAREKLIVFHVTKGLVQFKQKTPSLAGADMAGLVKMLGSEYAKVQSKTIDIDCLLSEEKEIADIVANELRYSAEQPEICYRKGERYVACMHELDSEKSREFGGLTVDKEGVVVITGGTSGIGAMLAQELVEKGFQKLVLMGISSMPAKETWTKLMGSGELSETVKRKIEHINRLEQKGAYVEVYTGSLTDREKLNSYFNSIRETLGQIIGVIHCAGLTNMENPSFVKKTAETMKKVLEPKVEGLQVLHDIFRDDKLQFFLLFSSVSGVIPALSVGNSDYAMANAFMNYFADYQSMMGNTYYKSFNWPSWNETGMGEVKSPVYVGLGLKSITNSQGISLMRRGFRYSEVSCLTPLLTVPSVFDSTQMLKARIKLESKKEPEKENKLESRKQRSGNTQNQSVLEKLKDVFSKELGIPVSKLKESVAFNDFGVDSILMAELLKKIDDEFGTKIEPTVIIEYSNLVDLSAYIANLVTTPVNERVPQKAVEVKKEDKQSKKTTLGFQTKCLIVKKKHNTSKKAARTGNQKIAVVGMACNFPKSPDIDTLWKNLCQGVDCVTEPPADRWNVEELFSEEHITGKTYSKWAGFIEGFEYFDPGYFKINEKEAKYLDPMIRLTMENAVQCLRDAGYQDREVWGKKLGVFMGARMTSAYAGRMPEPVKSGIVDTAQNFVTAYLSHYLNTKGPSMVVDTACSSSLVSINLACQSLLTGESEIALAGGVDLLLDEQSFIFLSESQALSPDGKCHTFDEKANGFVLGEGCGCVMLKTLDKALEDKDHIYAVIDSIAVNNDGNTMGVTTPNPDAQCDVIMTALEKGGVSAESVGFIEAHGTGTMIGDPIELRALTNVFRKYTESNSYCGIGSIKTNMGHLLSAAGIAGFIKTVLCVYHKKLVPTLHCDKPNPRFKFEQSPFFIIQELQDWKDRNGVHRGGVSSFGFGGTNAHIIVSDDFVQDKTDVRSCLPPQQFDKKKYWLEKLEDKPKRDTQIKRAEEDVSLNVPLKPMLEIIECDEDEEVIEMKPMLVLIDETEE